MLQHLIARKPDFSVCVSCLCFFFFPGSVIRLKGGILHMALMDSSGSLQPPASECWYDLNAPEEEREKTRRRRPASPPSSQENQDTHYAVVCSEKQAKVVALPSQNCIFEHNITETSYVLRADVVVMSAGICIPCFCANGHIMALRYACDSPAPDSYGQTFPFFC